MTAAGPRLRIAVRGGRRRQSGTRRFLRRRLVHPLPTSRQLPRFARRSPLSPDPKLGRRAPARLEIGAPRIHISNMIFGVASTACRRRAHKRPRCAVCSSFGVRLPKDSPQVSCAYEVLPTHTRPCVLLPGAFVAPPKPCGAHTHGRFLSFLFPTKSCCSKPRNKIKISRRTPK